MAAKPPLPGGFDLPREVNGWVLDLDSNRNGHDWRAADAPRSVAVFSTFSDTVRVNVFDDRVDGFANKIQPVDRRIGDGESEAEAVAWAVEKAVAWMHDHDPCEWDHPTVNEAVFDAPTGYVLDRYYLEPREHLVYYRRPEAESRTKLSAGGEPDEYTPETCPYLYVRALRGSGNATVALAPWLRAHGPSSKYSEVEPVVDPPDECGLDIALRLARDWARDHVAGDEPAAEQAPKTGQTGLRQFT